MFEIIFFSRTFLETGEITVTIISICSNLMIFTIVRDSKVLNVREVYAISGKIVHFIIKH